MTTSTTFRAYVPIAIAGVLEAPAWRDTDEIWLREAMRELAYPDADTRELSDGRVETTIQILRIGDFEQRGGAGKFTVDEIVLADLVRNFHEDAKRGVGGHEVFITIGHKHELDGAPAAGWITDVWRAADGLFARIRLNSRTVSLIREGEFRYFSIDYTSRGSDDAGKIVGSKLLSGAITNFPFLKGMQPFQLSALLGDAGDEPMSLTADQVKQIVLDSLKEALPGAVGTAVKAQLAELETSLTKSLSEKLKPAPADTSSSASPDLKTLSDRVGGLESQVTKATQENKRLSDALALSDKSIEARDINDLVRDGVEVTGKMSAGEVPGWGTPQWDPQKWLKEDGRFATVGNLRAHLAKAPVIVKLADRPGPGAPPPETTKQRTTLSDDEARSIGFKDAAEMEKFYNDHERVAS